MDITIILVIWMHWSGLNNRRIQHKQYNVDISLYTIRQQIRKNNTETQNASSQCYDFEHVSFHLLLALYFIYALSALVQRTDYTN